MYERNRPADTEVSAERGEDAPGTGAEMPLQHMVKSMVKSAPLHHMEGHGGAEIHQEPEKDPTHWSR